MDGSFFNWIRGNRINQYAGLVMDQDVNYKVGGRDSMYLDVPIGALYDGKDDVYVAKGLRNQYLKVIPACTMDVKGSFAVLVEPNPLLAEYGMIQPGYYLHPGSGMLRPSFYISLRKDLDLKDIKDLYAIRLYLRG
jgi:hypothetical protein